MQKYTIIHSQNIMAIFIFGIIFSIAGIVLTIVYNNLSIWIGYGGGIITASILIGWINSNKDLDVKEKPENENS